MYVLLKVEPFSPKSDFLNILKKGYKVISVCENVLDIEKKYTGYFANKGFIGESPIYILSKKVNNSNIFINSLKDVIIININYFDGRPLDSTMKKIIRDIKLSIIYD